MKKLRGWLIAALCAALCAGIVWLTLRLTAEYPGLGQPVSYPVNQTEGFTLTIEEPTWSPFKGYTIRWAATADSENVYTFTPQSSGFEFLERRVDGQWYRMACLQEQPAFNSVEFALGGETASRLEGSLVQKYEDYGTRLEPGVYRLVLEMTGPDGKPQYLAAEFAVK